MHRVTTTALILVLLGCTHADAVGASRTAPRKIVTLSLPRAATENDLIRAIVTTGSLPAGMRLIARLPNGEVIGTIAPYGPNRAGSYTIAVPPHAVHDDNKVTMHFELRDRSGTVRAPDDTELVKVELHVVPKK